LSFIVCVFEQRTARKPGLARGVLEAAYADAGLALDFYTGFDADWNDPA